LRPAPHHIDKRLAGTDCYRACRALIQTNSRISRARHATYGSAHRSAHSHKLFSAGCRQTPGSIQGKSEVGCNTPANIHMSSAFSMWSSVTTAGVVLAFSSLVVPAPIGSLLAVMRWRGVFQQTAREASEASAQCRRVTRRRTANEAAVPINSSICGQIE
jgi:hypothetical protein